MSFFASSSFAAGVLSLDRTWRYQLDPTDKGLDAKWFSTQFEGQLKLSGSPSEQGIGDDSTLKTPWTGQIVDRSCFVAPQYAPYRQAGNVKLAFWLQPEKYYKGAAWYQCPSLSQPTGKVGASCLFSSGRTGKHGSGWTMRQWAGMKGSTCPTIMTLASCRRAPIV